MSAFPRESRQLSLFTCGNFRLAGKRLIGAFTIYRQRVRPFDEKTLQLARMFADQSVIAIENARMMSELRSEIRRPGRLK